MALPSSTPQEALQLMCYPLRTPNQDYHVITGMKILRETERAEEELRLSIDSGDRECTFGHIQNLLAIPSLTLKRKKFMEIRNSDALGIIE